VSTEQRDKAGKVIHQATRLRDRLVREANKPLDVEIVGAMGQMIDLLESAHAATMPEREFVELLIAENLIETSHRDYGSGYFTTLSPGDIADAVLALLNKEGEE